MSIVGAIGPMRSIMNIGGALYYLIKKPLENGVSNLYYFGY